MSNRIADLRSPVTTLEEARALFAQMALTEKRLAVSDARYERNQAQSLAEHREATAPRRLAVETMRGELAAYIAGHRSEFEDPRTVKTELGEFGLRTVTEVLITDFQTLMATLHERGYTECFEVVERPLKPALAKRLKAGEELPGAALNTGDTVVCKVSKALLDEARESLEEREA